ncbi:hypothetical protein [Maribacter antarcticus]|uniref:hypothetical protein n=1 Tax=Maribacter antarcticus TaxID=505250 RepID=UPI00047E8D3E|nr:hypothetical protein [Maribacter antarcticus]
MKNRIYALIFFTILSLTINSCNSDDDKNVIENLNGNYTGTFTVEYSNGDTFSNPVTVSFNEDNNYQSSANNDYFPAGGNGTYEKNNSTIEYYDINIWTANFDWNLILNGEYNYSINGDELLISANKNDVGFYKYELTKE